MHEKKKYRSLFVVALLLMHGVVLGIAEGIKHASAVYTLTVFPAALLEWIGLPVIQNPPALYFLPVINLTIIGWIICVLIWSLIYWIIAVVCIRACQEKIR